MARGAWDAAVMLHAHGAGRPRRLRRDTVRPCARRRAAPGARRLPRPAAMYPADDADVRLRLLVHQLTAMRERLRQEVQRSRALRAWVLQMSAYTPPSRR